MRPASGVVGTDDGRAAPADLIAFAELREMLGVAKARAYVITRDRDFPAPWYVDPDHRIRLWRRADVEEWMDQHRPGWRAGG